MFDFFNSGDKERNTRRSGFHPDSVSQSVSQSHARAALKNSKPTRLHSTRLSVTSENVWKRFPVAGEIQGDVVESKILRNKVSMVITVYLRLISMCPNLE